MKATFWIGCIFIILLFCTGLCMASDVVENSTTESNETVPAVATATEAPVSVEETEVVSVEENETNPAPEEVETVTINETTTESASNNISAPVVAQTEIQAADQIQNQLESFVKETKMTVQKAGKDAAISAFNDRLGPYANPTMSVFAYDTTGKLLADPMDLSAVGTNQIGATDSEGTRYVQMMIDTAKNGEGFVEFLAPNIMEQEKVMKKIVYVTPIDGSWFIGSGVFLNDETEQTNASTEDASPVNETVVMNETSSDLATSA